MQSLLSLIVQLSYHLLPSFRTVIEDELNLDRRGAGDRDSDEFEEQN
jgi:hypothetical protein